MAVPQQDEVGVEVDRQDAVPFRRGQVARAAGWEGRSRRSGSAGRARRRRPRTPRGPPRSAASSVTSPTSAEALSGKSDATAGLRSRPTTAAPRARSDSTQALPIPEAAPVTSATSPAKTGRPPALASLACSRSQYSHVENVAGRQSPRAAQPLGALDGVHGVLVDLGGQGGLGGVAAGGEEPQLGIEDDARRRVEHGLLFFACGACSAKSSR